jgi:hypothetical protein
MYRFVVESGVSASAHLSTSRFGPHLRPRHCPRDNDCYVADVAALALGYRSGVVAFFPEAFSIVCNAFETNNALFIRHCCSPLYCALYLSVDQALA